MKRSLVLSALLLAAGPPLRAAQMQVQTISRISPAAPVPVIGSRLQPLNVFTNPTLAAPKLTSIWSAMPMAPAIQTALPAAPALTQIQEVAVQAAPAQTALAVTAEKLAALQQDPKASGEAVALRVQQTFDGQAAGKGVPSAEAPAVLDSPAGTTASTPRPLRLIITGPPGSGKGTYAAKIAAEYGVPHISVGELLRAYAKTHPAVAKIMATGQLVESKPVLDVVRERLAQPDIKERGFILDGFPRRPNEADALQGMLGEDGVDGIIELDVPEAELLRRILARGRADDKADVFRERMKIYREQTIPAVERFKHGTPVLSPEVSGSSIEANYARVKAALGGLLDKLLGR
ncbi:MAG: nucleoside monophosphate kinase [Elusimicrobia bacterium]|nr:nucleoside monophosphate kinase [Elusimicrobiota bacterium]